MNMSFSEFMIGYAIFAGLVIQSVLVAIVVDRLVYGPRPHRSPRPKAVIENLDLRLHPRRTGK